MRAAVSEGEDLGGLRWQNLAAQYGLWNTEPARFASRGLVRVESSGEGLMRRSWRLTAIGMLVVGMLALGTNPSAAEPRAHVYLLRGLMNIFSLGMDTLAEQLNRRGVYATVHGYGEWQSLADRAAGDSKAGKEGPIILIGHSLGD